MVEDGAEAAESVLVNELLAEWVELLGRRRRRQLHVHRRPAVAVIGGDAGGPTSSDEEVTQRLRLPIALLPVAPRHSQSVERAGGYRLDAV